MSRPKSVKIYIKIDNHICDFMWANTAQDGSIFLGFSNRKKENILWMINKDRKKLNKGNFIVEESLTNPKITFHNSGYYKLSTKIGNNRQDIDRCSILGKPLNEIVEPRRMLEVLLPCEL